MGDRSAGVSEQWVGVAGGELRVRRHRSDDGTGGAAGTPVLFVHGAFVNGHLWDGVIDTLGAAAEPLDLIAPDLPLGAHHRPLAADADLSLPAVVEMLGAVLDALGVDQAVVAANDSGGAITQQLLTTHPTRISGVLLTSTETADNFPPRYFRFLFPPLRLRAPMWSTCQLLRTGPGRRLPITFGHLIERRLTTAEAATLMGPLWTSAGARHDLRRFLTAALADQALMHAAEARFASFGAPVDVAWSAGDRIFPDRDATRLAAAFPAGRRVADISGSGSLSPLDQPGQVADRLLGLIARSTSARRTVSAEG